MNTPARFIYDDAPLITEVKLAVVLVDFFSGETIRQPADVKLVGSLEKPVRNASGHYVFLRTKQAEAYQLHIDTSRTAWFSPRQPLSFPSPIGDREDVLEAGEYQKVIRLLRRPGQFYQSGTTAFSGVVLEDNPDAAGGRPTRPIANADIRVEMVVSAEPGAEPTLFKARSDVRGAFLLPMTWQVSEFGQKRLVNLSISRNGEELLPGGADRTIVFGKLNRGKVGVINVSKPDGNAE